MWSSQGVCKTWDWIDRKWVWILYQAVTISTLSLVSVLWTLCLVWVCTLIFFGQNNVSSKGSMFPRTDAWKGWCFHERTNVSTPDLPKIVIWFCFCLWLLVCDWLIRVRVDSLWKHRSWEHRPLETLGKPPTIQCHDSRKMLPWRTSVKSPARLWIN